MGKVVFAPMTRVNNLTARDSNWNDWSEHWFTGLQKDGKGLDNLILFGKVTRVCRFGHG